MKFRFPSNFFYAASLVLLSTAVISCEEDPKLVAKREKQKAEIIQLTGELAILEEKIKAMPPDVSEELAETKKAAEQQAAEVATLEAEVAQLQARKAAAQTEFDAYKAKYPIN